MTRPLTRERLAAMTLQRQFPRVRGRRRPAICELYRRLGPVQTQVPRSAFLFLASRLPGTTYDDILGAFEHHELVKASTIRGTVHSSSPEQHAWLSAVTRRPRALLLRNHLKLERLTPDDVTAEIERFTSGGWRERKEIVQHVRGWLAEHESETSSRALSTTAAENFVWGHPALVRRPGDARWETRTDTLHRYAPDLYAAASVDASAAAGVDTSLDAGVGAGEATRMLVRQHLGSYGPATRRDVAWWMGARLTDVDAAVDGLGDEVVRLSGPDAVTYLDLAEPPRGGPAHPGLRLVPEFDGLLLGYEGVGRDRFADAEHLAVLTGMATGNGVMQPMVVHDGRIVARWKLVSAGGRRDVEVLMLPGHRRLEEDLFAEQIGAVETALAIAVTDVRVRTDADA